MALRAQTRPPTTPPTYDPSLLTSLGQVRSTAAQVVAQTREWEQTAMEAALAVGVPKTELRNLGFNVPRSPRQLVTKNTTTTAPKTAARGRKPRSSAGGGTRATSRAGT